MVRALFTVKEAATDKRDRLGHNNPSTSLLIKILRNTDVMRVHGLISQEALINKRVERKASAASKGY